MKPEDLQEIVHKAHRKDLEAVLLLLRCELDAADDAERRAFNAWMRSIE